MNDELESKFIAERAKIELQQVRTRAEMKDSHREELKEFDKETKRMLADCRRRYAAAIKGPAKSADGDKE